MSFEHCLLTLQDAEVTKSCSTAVLQRLCKSGKVQATSFVVSLVFGTASQATGQEPSFDDSCLLGGVPEQTIGGGAAPNRFGVNEQLEEDQSMQSERIIRPCKRSKPGAAPLDSLGGDAMCIESGAQSNVPLSSPEDEASTYKDQKELVLTKNHLGAAENKEDEVAADSRPRKHRRHEKADLNKDFDMQSQENNPVTLALAARPLIGMLKSRGVLDADSAWPALRALLQQNVAANTVTVAATMLKCFEATAEQVRAVYKAVTGNRKEKLCCGEEACKALVTFCASNKRPGALCLSPSRHTIAELECWSCAYFNA
jgi:hypothetical protein